MSNANHKGTAVITGASTGIGAVYADRLARRGHDLILVARNRDRLNELAKRLTTQTGRSVEVVIADLTNSADLHRVEQILQTDASITTLVNNAGIGSATPLVDSNVDAMESMIDLNVTALTRLTYAVAPKLSERRQGTIINIASIVAVAPEILNGVYGATKAYVLAFSQSLHHELASKGIRIHAVLPGAISTPFWDVAGYPVDNLPPANVMDVNDLVDAALAGLDAGELATVPSLPDIVQWDAYQAARAGFTLEKLSRAKPAARYGVH
jgi:short-subunit dehydrogenase